MYFQSAQKKDIMRVHCSITNARVKLWPKITVPRRIDAMPIGWMSPLPYGQTKSWTGETGIG